MSFQRPRQRNSPSAKPRPQQRLNKQASRSSLKNRHIGTHNRHTRSNSTTVLPRSYYAPINASKPPADKALSPTRLFGQGVDIAYIPRFAETYAKFGQKFLAKSLHPKEIAMFNSLPKRADGSDDVAKQSQYLASRWAFKEAMVKATGKRLLFPEMSLARDSGAGQDPRVNAVVQGNAAEFFTIANLTAQVSISHDNDYAIATVTVHQYEPFISFDDPKLLEFEPGKRPVGAPAEAQIVNAV